MRPIVASGGVALAFLLSFWALFLDVAILYETYGLWTGALGLIMAPFTFLAVPWYAGLALDNWLPLGVGYGSLAVGIMFTRAGFATVPRPE